jgi:hypothetical protein
MDEDRTALDRSGGIVPVDDDGAGQSAPRSGPAGDPWGTFDRWASNLFVILVALSVVAALFVFAAGDAVPGFAIVLALGTVAADIAVMYVLMTGLRDARPWGRPAAVSVLWVFVGTGLLDAALDLVVQKLTIPLGAILAIWVLSRRPGDARLPALSVDARRVVVGLTAVVLLTSLPSAFGDALSRAPAWAIAQPEDLVLGVSANCLDPARITPGDDRILVRVLWRWTADDLLPGGTEGIRIAWPADAGLVPDIENIIVPADGRLDPRGQPTDGIDADHLPPLEDVSLLPASDVEADIAVAFDGSSPSVRQGTIVVPFTRDEAMEPMAVDFVATWAHDDHWTRAAFVSCDLPLPAGSTAPGG